METLIQDLRCGFRALLRQPGFTFLVVLTLALGIGANTTIFSVVNATLIEPLPFREPHQLISIEETNPKVSPEPLGASFANFKDWQAQSQVFQSLASSRMQRFILTGGDEPAFIVGQSVSSGFFSLLGAEAMIGQTFADDDDRNQDEKLLVLSYEFWQKQFGADPNITGKTITLNDAAYTIIGVMPEGFKFLRPADVWTPLQLPAQLRETRGAHFLRVIGRLKEGASIEQARAEMDRLAGQLEVQHPVTNTGWRISLTPMQEKLVGKFGTRLLLAFAAVGLLLLIACVNVANLLLARAFAQQREVAIRAALGATRWRLMRQMLTENLLIGLMGGATGLLIALWGMPLLLAMSPGDIPRINEVSIDASVLVFTIAISAGTSLLCGLVPAIRISKPDLNLALKQGASPQSVGFKLGQQHLRGMLVVCEIAMALVLLVGAGLLARSLMKLMAVSPGFQPENALTMEISLPSFKYREPSQQMAFFSQLLERASNVPGVESAALTMVLPLSGNDSQNSFLLENDPANSEARWAGLRLISPDYFRAMGIPLLNGRDFNVGDTGSSPEVIIINEAMRRRYWPDQDAIGKRIFFGESPSTIVGVAGNVKHLGLDAEEKPEMYMPFLQSPTSQAILVARAKTDPLSLVAALRGEVSAIDKDQPVERIQTLTEVLSQSVAQPRFSALLLGLFSLLALILAASGIFGVVAYSVSQGRHEIGIRMALGAQRVDVLKLVVKQGTVLILAGVVIGIAASLALTRVLSSLLFEVSATDPLTFTLIPLLLAGVAVSACAIPARRATRVDPMVALRYE
jgi:putative ABC transport system permease protein